jgi:YdjC-like protein
MVVRGNTDVQAGRLIVNADDWGQNRETTDRILECVVRGAVSSTSAMVFMEDSERAAAVAQERGVDAGLHVNLTTAFSGPGCPDQLLEHQGRVSSFLRRSRFAWVTFHPGLMNSFRYVVAAQLEEFFRLYGTEPERLDGHHHMHLCSNVLLGGLLPAGKLVRRNFSFSPGEKSLCNRLYRSGVDRILARRHRLTDFFFSLQPLERPGHLQRKCALASECSVELCAHPYRPEEYRFLAGGEILHFTGGLPIASRFALSSQG